MIDAILDKYGEIGRCIVGKIENDKTQHPAITNSKASVEIGQLFTKPDTNKVPGDGLRSFGIVSKAKGVYEVAKIRWYNCNSIDSQGWAINQLKDDNARIDGETRYKLLLAAAVLHELGKFQPSIEVTNGQVELTQRGYEVRGESLIREAGKELSAPQLEPLPKIFKEFKATPGQIDYIAKCVRAHNSLETLVELFKEQQDGEIKSFIQGKDFKEFAQGIAKENDMDMSVEKGVLFLAAQLGKLTDKAADSVERYRKRSIKAAITKARAFLENTNVPIADEYLAIVRKLKQL
jgi:hypothetical protein